MKDFNLSTNLFKKVFTFLFIYLSGSILIFGQYAQMGSKLVGTGAIGTAVQGFTVCISGDGKTIAAAGVQDDSQNGAVWVYKLIDNRWTQIEKLIGSGVASGGPRQGETIAISENGNLLVFGSPTDGNFGSVWTFTYSGSNWVQYRNKLAGDASNSISSISLSKDGNTLALGGISHSSTTNLVWIYKNTGNSWQKTSTITSSGISSLSLSGDGKYLAIGLGTSIYSTVGGVCIYKQDNGEWKYMDKLVGKSSIPIYYEGSKVSLSSDGKTLVVEGLIGSPQIYNIAAAYLYTFSGGNWVQNSPLIISPVSIYTGAAPYFNLSLSGDGKSFAIGGNYTNNLTGATCVYTLSGNNWNLAGDKISGSNSIGTSGQGTNVSLSTNGKTLVVGGPWDDTSTGAVWVFTAPGWNSDTVSSGGGTTEPITSDTLSISGTIHQGSGLLTDGIVMAIEKTTNKSKILRVTSGNFTLDSLARGEYILYAVPNPVTVPHYLPTFYVNKVRLQDAVTLSLRGHIRSVDIYLAALASTVSGTHTITGRFSYEDGNSKDSTFFTTNWFGHAYTASTEIPITTHACGNMPVLLYNSQNALIKSALTDSLGYFTFKNIPSGTYKLLGQRNGYASKNEGMVTIGSNSTEIANLKMEAVVTAFEDEIDVNNSKVTVYPNPFKDEIIIKGFIGEVTIYDLTGKIFHQTMLNENESIDTQEWPVGFYILKAGNRTEKIIKTN